MKNKRSFSQLSVQSKLVQRQRQVIHRDVLTRSAVLVPIVNTPSGLELLFTKRTESVEHHKGQISFPGGAADKNDESPAETALRESFEELGIGRSAVAILGMLDDLQTPSGFIITPVVGFIERLPPLRINSDEVAEVISIPIEVFFDNAKRHSKIIERDGMKAEVFFYEVWKEPVWGATAFFVKQLMDVLNTS